MPKPGARFAAIRKKYGIERRGKPKEYVPNKEVEIIPGIPLETLVKQLKYSPDEQKEILRKLHKIQHPKQEKPVVVKKKKKPLVKY